MKMNKKRFSTLTSFSLTSKWMCLLMNCRVMSISPKTTVKMCQSRSLATCLATLATAKHQTPWAIWASMLITKRRQVRASWWTKFWKGKTVWRPSMRHLNCRILRIRRWRWMNWPCLVTHPCSKTAKIWIAHVAFQIRTWKMPWKLPRSSRSSTMTIPNCLVSRFKILTKKTSMKLASICPSFPCCKTLVVHCTPS